MISVVLFLRGTRLRVWVADAGREVRGKQNRLKMSLRRRGKVLRGDQLYEVQMTGASAVVIQRLNYFDCFILCEGHPIVVIHLILKLLIHLYMEINSPKISRSIFIWK